MRNPRFSLGHRLAAALLTAGMLFSLTLALCGCKNKKGREYAYFTLFTTITENVNFVQHSRLTVDITRLPLTEEEGDALWALFEDFAEEKQIHVYPLTLTEAKDEGYVKKDQTAGEYSFLNGFHFTYGNCEETEEGDLTFEETYAWKSTYDAFGAANVIMRRKGNGWILAEYDNWSGMMNP